MFIYCFDEKLKEKLLAQDFKYVMHKKNEQGDFWVFEEKPDYLFSRDERDKLVFSNKLSF